MRVTTGPKTVPMSANNQRVPQVAQAPKIAPVAPIAPKPVKTEKPKYEKNFPPMEESDDDFLPLKELAKTITVEPKVYPVKSDSHSTEEGNKNVTSTGKPKAETGSVKSMSAGNLADLRSALDAVMKKSSPKPEEFKSETLKVEFHEKKVYPVKSDSHLTGEEPKPEAIKEEPKAEPKINPVKSHSHLTGEAEESKPQTKEISEEELKKILGL
jgi:hypothetical protein